MIEKVVYPIGEGTPVFSDKGKKIGTLYNGVYLAPLGVYPNAYSNKFGKKTVVVFDIPEYEAIKDLAHTIQMSDSRKGAPVLREIAMDVVTEQGAVISTPKGQRWAVPVEYWRTE